MKTHYDTLGISQNATIDEIKKAYRALVRKYHPDINSAKDATKKTQAINAAYEILSDKITKEKYDAYLNAQKAKRQNFNNRTKTNTNTQTQTNTKTSNSYNHSHKQSKDSYNANANNYAKTNTNTNKQQNFNNAKNNTDDDFLFALLAKIWKLTDTDPDAPILFKILLFPVRIYWFCFLCMLVIVLVKKYLFIIGFVDGIYIFII